MLLEEGRTCWRIARADRLRVIVDAAEYFRVVKQAMLLAQHSIFLIGWDFDTRVQFEPETQKIEGPNTLGDFVEWLPDQRADLNVYLLKWDLGGFEMLGRKQMPYFLKNALTDARLHFHLDGAHPQGSAHHSKIVAIDDSIAFCGGIDMTIDRWDTREHLDDDPRRVEPNGQPYKAWHDATTIVSGPVAAALGDLARHRWKRATGNEIDRPPQARRIWPDNLAPDFENVDVGVARTAPEHDGDNEVREIEALYLAAIGSARKTLYVESQYLASRRLAEALAARLQEPDGPEIIVVLPEKAEGWLRRMPMDGARKKLLHLLWNADRFGRLGAYYPVTANGNWIYVHAKILVVDDQVIRVGSSNLNNRSMGFDTECDIIVEAPRFPPETRSASEGRITGIRNDLVAEHLAVEPSRLVEEIEACGGSLLAAIERLRGDGKTLVSFDPGQISDEDSALAENDLADPEAADRSFLERLSRGLSSVVAKAGIGRKNIAG